jgi:hypothetical protein
MESLVHWKNDFDELQKEKAELKKEKEAFEAEKG